VYLNEFADTTAPRDMTGSAEFASLLQSASDLGIPHSQDVRYVSRQTVARGLRFHFLEWGHPGAQPVVLLHGGNQSAHSWDLVSLHLSDRYHVYALDQRGHGDSEWSRDLDYSVGAKAQDALAFIEDQRIESPIVMGHSMGGMVTMTMALQAPHVARGVVLVDVGPELSDKGVEVVRNFVTRNVEFDDLDEFLDRVVQYDPFRTREHIARTVKYNMLQRVDGKYVSKVDHRRVPEPSTPAVGLGDLAPLGFPVLVVRGEESDVLEPEAAERFVAALPRGRLVTVARAGHNVHGANTPGFLEAVGPFVAELAG
jgi:pimeloyl-ACP methyl ester carboxylesterase